MLAGWTGRFEICFPKKTNENEQERLCLAIRQIRHYVMLSETPNAQRWRKPARQSLSPNLDSRPITAPFSCSDQFFATRYVGTCIGSIYCLTQDLGHKRVKTSQGKSLYVVHTILPNIKTKPSTHMNSMKHDAQNSRHVYARF